MTSRDDICRAIAKKWRKPQVIIIAIDPVEDTFEVASYGETAVLCASANEIARQIEEQLKQGMIST